MKTCDHEGCDRKHVARGYCRTHYGQVIERKPERRLIHTEDVEWMAETGETWIRAVERLGVKEKTLRRHLERADRYDLIQRMQRRSVTA